MCGQPMQGMNHLAVPAALDVPIAKPKRKGIVSAYNRKFGRELKAIRKRHMLKSGKWRSGWDAKKAMALAHKKSR